MYNLNSVGLFGKEYDPQVMELFVIQEQMLRRLAKQQTADDMMMTTTMVMMVMVMVVMMPYDFVTSR